jgi:hypothetical protein
LIKVCDRQSHALARKQVDLLNYDEPLFVEIKPYKKDRSKAQNRLYFAWLTDFKNTTVNEYAGNEVEYWHFEMKKKYLLRIYAESNPDYAAMLSAVRELKRLGLHQEYIAAMREIIKTTSTTNATVKQFTQYLDCISHHARMLGIYLRTDIPDYYEAYGK